MAQEADNQYEASDESSENELLDRSLSVWKGWNWNVKDVFDPIPLDLHTASSIGQYDAVSYTHLRAHETSLHLVCRLLLEKSIYFKQLIEKSDQITFTEIVILPKSDS